MGETGFMVMAGAAAIIPLILGIAYITVCTIAARRMARSRNRPVALWGWLGLFLGIIAIAILAVIGPEESTSQTA